MQAKSDAQGNISITFNGKERLALSKTGKSVIVCKVQRPERVAGTQVSFTLTAWVSKDDAIAEGLDMKPLEAAHKAALASAKSGEAA